MIPFKESLFVVTWFGEIPGAYLIKGWDAVLHHLNEQTGGDDGTIGMPWFAQFDDLDNWSLLNGTYTVADDERLQFSREIDEGVTVQITRITEEAH